MTRTALRVLPRAAVVAAIPTVVSTGLIAAVYSHDFAHTLGVAYAGVGLATGVLAMMGRITGDEGPGGSLANGGQGWGGWGVEGFGWRGPRLETDDVPAVSPTAVLLVAAILDVALAAVVLATAS